MQVHAQSATHNINLGVGNKRKGERQGSAMKETKVQTSLSETQSGFLYSGTYANLAIGNMLWPYCALF